MARADPVPPALAAALGPLATMLWRSPTGKLVLGRAAGAFHPEVVPPELAGVEAALAQARFETAPPLSKRQVERALRAAWGAQPGDVLDELGPCVASTPLAQVHRGRLA